MTQRIVQFTTPRGTVSLAHGPAMRGGSARPTAAPAAARPLDGVKRALVLFWQSLTTPRGELWRADELPDALLRDVDPELYEARLGRSTGWFAGDHHRLPPF